MMRTLTLLALLSAPLSAQAATFQTFGTPCAFDPPPLVATSLPRLGTTLLLETRSSSSTGYDSATRGTLLIGVSKTAWLGAPLPWTPQTFANRIGAGACGELSISIDLVIGMPALPSRSPVTTALPIPNAPSLLGISVYFQAVESRINTRGLLGLNFGVAAEARIGT